MSLKKIEEYLFLFFLFLLPFQTVFLLREPFIDGEKWQYGTIAIYGTDIILFLTLILFVIATWKKNTDLRLMISKIINRQSETLLAMFVLWAGLSIFWAEDRTLAGYFFVKMVLATGLFLVVRSIGIDMKKVVFVLLAAGVIQSGIGIAQFLSQQSIDSSLFGISAHEAYQAGSSVLKIDSGRFLRAYGTFPHPNMLGGFLGVILVFSVGWSVSVIRNRAATLFMFFGDLVVLLGLILAFSRVAWLGAGTGMLVLAIYSYRRLKCQKESIPLESECTIIPRPWNYGTFFKTHIVLGIAMIVFIIVLREQISPRFDTVTIEQEGSVSERMVSLQDAQSLIKEHPLIGVGAGNFTAAIIKQNPDRPIWSIQPAHNVFVLIWTELGVIGLVLFIAFLFQIVRRSNKNAIFGIAFLTLLSGFLLDHWLWTSHFGLLFFFLLAGLATRRGV